MHLVHIFYSTSNLDSKIFKINIIKKSEQSALMQEDPPFTQLKIILAVYSLTLQL